MGYSDIAFNVKQDMPDVLFLEAKNANANLYPAIAVVIGLRSFGDNLGNLVVADEFRKWTDATGKFSISAKLVEEKDGKVLLKKQDGSEVALPIERLSTKDQKYLTSLRESNMPKGKSSSGPAIEQKDVPRLREIAEKFYADLRNQTRTVARELMTETAQGLVDEGVSALVGLPSPDDTSKAIRVGRAKVTGKSAEVTVTMLVKGDPLRTNLHLRKVDDQWQVFV